MANEGENKTCSQESLYMFCKNGKEQDVEKMLKEANESELSYSTKEKCLYATIIAGNSDLFKCLLSRWFPDCQDIASQRDGSQQKKPTARNALELSDLFKGTCLYATVTGGNSDLLKYLLSGWGSLRQHIAYQRDDYGNTAMHLAVRRNRLDLVKLLLDFESNLCHSRNKDGETPLFVAVRLGMEEIVEPLVKRAPKCMLELCGNKNVLHLAVELHLFNIVRFLAGFLSKCEDKELTQIINHGVGKTLPNPDILPPVSMLPICGSSSVATGNDNSRDGKEKKKATKSGDATNLGDTPLHIAARRKCLQMVDCLLLVPGVEKYATNDKGFTALDIAKERTEYYERYKIIAKLSDYPGGQRPFMYNAPSPSAIKLAKANNIVEKDYHNRQNAEIVVAALLAAMTFSAVFQVPGGFQTENKHGIVIGAPTLIDYMSFKLFLIFDCVAFFLSLFVVFMWQISWEITTGDKMLFMYINSLLVCLSFAFTASGFIAAVYVMLAHKVKIFSVIVMASMAFILGVGFMAFCYKEATFSVKRARFNRLCGVPCWKDDLVEILWLLLERYHLLDILRKLKEWLVGHLVLGLCDEECRRMNDLKSTVNECSDGVNERSREDERCSPSPLLKGSQDSRIEISGL